MSCSSSILKSVIIFASVAVAAFGQNAPATPTFDKFVGEVTGKVVHVRSGPSTNYYAVVRLAAGDRINVVQEENGWYAIEPPAGCYSLVSKDYVDVGKNGDGVVNGSAVRVRAGSDLDPHRYAVQAKLDKGAEVKVLGEVPGGFLKIVPPSNACLWIHNDYVARVPDSLLKLERKKSGSKPVANTAEPAEKKTLAKSEPADKQADQAVEPVKKAVDKPVAENPDLEVDDTQVADAQAEPAQVQPQPAETEADSDVEKPRVALFKEKIAEGDELMKAELAKPIEDRDFADSLALFQEIVEQSDDEYASKYARRRIIQLKQVIERVEAIRQVRALSNKVTKERKDALAGRNNMRPEAKQITRGFDAKGELRKSMVYSSPIGPRRYRLIDPDLEVPRTLCYVELPQDSKIDISRYLGRLVGVRARDKFLETGDVNPIHIVVIEDIVLLDEADNSDSDVDIAVPVDTTAEEE